VTIIESELIFIINNKKLFGLSLLNEIFIVTGYLPQRDKD